MERRFGGSRFGGRDRDDRRGGFRPSGGNFEKPVKVGETYEVEIKEVGSKGDGIARVKNFVVFVANTNKGEKCNIRITSVGNRFATGEKVSEKATKEKMEEEPLEEEEVEEEMDEE